MEFRRCDSSNGDHLKEVEEAKRREDEQLTSEKMLEFVLVLLL